MPANFVSTSEIPTNGGNRRTAPTINKMIERSRTLRGEYWSSLFSDKRLYSSNLFAALGGKFLNRRDQLCVCKRLGDEQVCAAFQCSFPIFTLAFRRQHKYR